MCVQENDVCVQENDMREIPLIRATLLTRIKDETDADAWQEFVRFYGPVVYRFARKRGLRDGDAAELMQEVLCGMARNAETMEYSPKHETTGGWLFTVAHNKIGNFLSARKNRPRGTGARGASDRNFQFNSGSDSASEPDSDWDTEYQRQLSIKAMDRVKQEFRSSIWQAFWKAAVDGRPVQEVGLELKMTPGAVYVAKNQVLVRLNEEVQRIRAETETW